MKKVVLIADDSPSIRKFISFALTMDGYDVISASDGMEAIEKIPTSKVDLVITDLNMPNIDGFELIKVIRGNQDLKEVPIIILSSLSSNEDIEHGLSCGANSYLVKPFNPKRIQYEVSKYLN